MGFEGLMEQVREGRFQATVGQDVQNPDTESEQISSNQEVPVATVRLGLAAEQAQSRVPGFLHKPIEALAKGLASLHQQEVNRLPVGEGRPVGHSTQSLSQISIDNPRVQKCHLHPIAVELGHEGVVRPRPDVDQHPHLVKLEQGHQLFEGGSGVADGENLGRRGRLHGP
jgi:hypothetical protein